MGRKAVEATATVIATGKEVNIYASKIEGETWIDESDFETKYKSRELSNIKIKNQS